MQSVSCFFNISVCKQRSLSKQVEMLAGTVLRSQQVGKIVTSFSKRWHKFGLEHSSQKT